MPRHIDFSKTGRGRVVALTVAGTLCCILFAALFDSYSFANGTWRWGNTPINNIIIPLLLAPPFFYFLLSRLRELAIAHERLELVASTDSLTSCLNRAAFSTLVDAYLAKFAQDTERCAGALLIVDVDHFKTINDTFGHDQGDVALQLIADAVRTSLRDGDLVGRLGGEEFCVFLPGVDVARATEVADRLRSAVGRMPFAPADTPYPITVSVGGASFCEPATFSQLYRDADRLLYEAKRSGRDRVIVSSVADRVVEVRLQ